MELVEKEFEVRRFGGYFREHRLCSTRRALQIYVFARDKTKQNRLFDVIVPNDETIHAVFYMTQSFMQLFHKL